MDYQKIYHCPQCGTDDVMETGDYSPFKGKNGDWYQYYSSYCPHCGKKFYNVAHYIGALTAEQINELAEDITFSSELDKYADGDMVLKYHNEHFNS